MTAALPFVSVVLVVRNEAPHIEECVAQIVGQDYPRDRLEIVAVDGMSDDGTRQILESLATDGIPLRILTNPALGRAQGLNLGIRAARGDVIARIDARTLVDRDYFRRCVTCLEESGADNVGGVQRPLAAGMMQQAIGVAMAHPFGVGDAQFRIGLRSGFVDTLYPGCFRRDVFARVGFFDEAAPIISEDSDLNYRIRQAGGRVYLDARIVVGYRPRETLLELWRMYFRYGAARAGSVLKHRRFSSWRPLVPVAFTGAVVVLGAGAVVSAPLSIALLVLMGAYLAADVAMAATLAVRYRDAALFWRLCLVFPCMHLAFGLGFWRRLIQRPRPGSYWGH